MAILVDVYTPTIGLGCWSGSIALYPILSAGSWTLQFIKRPNKFVLVLSHCFNCVAVLWLLLLTIFFVSVMHPLVSGPVAWQLTAPCPTAVWSQRHLLLLDLPAGKSDWNHGFPRLLHL